MYQQLPAISSPRLSNMKWASRLTNNEFFSPKSPNSNRRHFLHMFLVAVVVVDLFIFVLYVGYFRTARTITGGEHHDLEIIIANTTAANITILEPAIPEPIEEEEPETEYIMEEDVTKNATLGFGEIMYISMPYRTDRQDAMELLAAYSDLKFNMFPGVDGDSIHDKAKPPKSNKLNKAELGCWRAHVNVWRHILDQNYTTALILEDDIDFSAHIKEVMSTLSVELRSENNTVRLPDAPTQPEKDGQGKLKQKEEKKEVERKEPTFVEAPYGLDWDILTLGHCFNTISPEYPNRLYAYQDDYSPTDGNFPEFTGKGVRVIRPSYGPVCTFGYAVTREGVEKLLYHVAYNELDDPVDLKIMNLLMQGKLRGYTISPSLFSPWRVGGAKDSDIRLMPGEEVVEGNSGWELTDSIRKEMAAKYKDVNWWSMVKQDEDKKAKEAEIAKKKAEEEKKKKAEADRLKKIKENQEKAKAALHQTVQDDMDEDIAGQVENQGNKTEEHTPETEMKKDAGHAKVKPSKESEEEKAEEKVEEASNGAGEQSENDSTQNSEEKPDKTSDEVAKEKAQEITTQTPEDNVEGNTKEKTQEETTDDITPQGEAAAETVEQPNDAPSG